MCHFCHVLNKNPRAPQHRSSQCLDKGNAYSHVPMARRMYENGRHVPRSNSNSNSNPDSNSSNCSICWDQPPNVAFIPCGHVAACETCSPQVQNCPICRQGITDKQKIYLV